MAHRFHIQPVQVAGCPGPPSCFLREDEDEEDMMLANGPDDLGDLMQQMREGAAWAESLAIDGDLSLCGAPAGAASAAAAAATSLAELGGYASPTPLAAPRPAVPLRLQPTAAAAAAGSVAGPAAATAGGPPDLGPGTLAAVGRRQQREAEQEAAMAELQPAMRALLMHPGAAGGGQLMIPVGGAAPAAAASEPAAAYCAPPQGLSCAGALAAARPDGSLPSWPAPALQAAHFYSQPASFYAARTAAPPQAFQASPFAFYQAPVSFMAAPPGGGSPPPPLDAAAALAWQQQMQVQQYGGAGCVPLPPTFLPGYLQTLPLPQPNPSAASGSANASDGTTLRLRSSFDSDTGGSISASGALPPALGARTSSGALASAVVPQLPALGGDGGFGHSQAPFERQGPGACAGDWAWRLPAGGGKCDAPSDSSDCDDSGARERDEGSAQVVPEVKPELVADMPLALVPPPPPPLLPLPLPLAAAAPLLAPLPLPLPGTAATPLQAPLGVWSAADFPPLPTFCGFYDTPAAHAARLARRASLERYRLKKARRGTGKKIRYVKRKVNADKRPRIKGRFIKAEDAADLLAAAAGAADSAGLSDSHTSAEGAQPECSSAAAT
ncbi:hypothetical protein ABPG75_013953 [Micractinium tetrahymenae]